MRILLMLVGVIMLLHSPVAAMAAPEDTVQSTPQKAASVSSDVAATPVSHTNTAAATQPDAGVEPGVAASTQASPASQAVQGERRTARLLQTAHPLITKLKNGLTIYVLPDKRFPLVSTRLYVRAGSAYETPEEAGISHLLEHMVFKGTERRPKGGIARDVEAVGGYLNAATSFDYTVYLTDMPAQQWALGMDVVNDMAFHATLDPQEMEAEKDVVISELKRGKDSPGKCIFENLQAQTLAGTPYARPVIGFEKTVRSVTPQTIRAYIAKYYQPQNMLLVVVGDVDPQKVLHEATYMFASLQNTQDITPAQPLPAQSLDGKVQVTVERGPWNKVYLGMALPVPGDQDVSCLQLDVLAQLLGGDATSYLYKKYKYEKQLVDDISVDNYSFERVGMLCFTVQMDVDKVEPFWKEFTADIAALTPDVFSGEDIARAKLQIEDGLQRTKETLSGLASWKGRLQMFLGGEQGEQNIFTLLRDVDRAQLCNVMYDWLLPSRMSVSVLAPNDANLPDLQAIAQTAWPAKSAPQSAAASVSTGAVETVDLGHGRTVVLIPDTTMPYTAVDLYMPGGDSLVPPAQQGLAALAARVLTSGANGRTAPEMERYLASRAASLGAVTGRQTFGLSMREPSRFNADLFALFRDTMSKPDFAPAEVAREKQDQIAAIKAATDQPLGLVSMEMPPFLFPNGHPYGYRSMGTAAQVEGYSPADVRDFWRRQVEQPWVLAVAGDFDREAVLAFARTLPVPSDKGKTLDEPQWGTEKQLPLHMPNRQQAHLMLVFKTVPVDSPDAVGLEVLENVLAGQSGMLFNELRDKQGLGYTVTAFNRMKQKAGQMIFYIGTEPGKMAQAKAGFEKIIAELKAKPLPESVVRSAINKMRGDYYRERQSLGFRSGEAAMLKTLGRDVDFRKQRVAEAEKVTPHILQELAKKYLTFNDAYEVTVAP